jgi:hypothetical protein
MALGVIAGPVARISKQRVIMIGLACSILASAVGGYSAGPNPAAPAS